MTRIVGLVVAVGLLSSAALAQSRTVHVRAHTNQNGTYVPEHERTAPNRTRNDNWTTKDNMNPRTGEEGTKPRDESYDAPAPPPGGTY